MLAERSVPFQCDLFKDSQTAWSPGYYIYNYFYLDKKCCLVKIFYVSPLLTERAKINGPNKRNETLNVTPKPHRDKYGENI